MTSSLVIKAKTWKHENHGLFDYNSRDLQPSHFTIQNPSTIYLNHDNCYVPDNEVFPESVPLVSISRIHRHFQVSLLSEDPNSRLWKVIRYSKCNHTGHHLQEGDWLKLGKVRLFVKHLSTSKSSLSEEVFKSFYHTNPLDKEQESLSAEVSESQVCRICLCSTSSEDDPLITPCKCAGTMSKIHVNCLKEWISNKFTLRFLGKSMSIYPKDLICELCKHDIPPVITYKNSSFSLISFSGPSNPSFIVFEEYPLDRPNRVGLHLVSLKPGSSAVIGRSNESDLKINDITVSRKHCVLALRDNDFFINDKESKFGTLVKVNRLFRVKSGMDVTVQAGRTILRMWIDEPFNFRFCCKRDNKVQGKVSNATQSDGIESVAETAAFMVHRAEI